MCSVLVYVGLACGACPVCVGSRRFFGSSSASGGGTFGTLIEWDKMVVGSALFLIAELSSAPLPRICLLRCEAEAKGY